MSDPQSRVLVEVTIAAPLDTVWSAVRESEQISNWFGWDTTFGMNDADAAAFEAGWKRWWAERVGSTQG